jgi:hypothetical protein
LTDPNGKNVSITIPVDFVSSLEENAYYTNNGQWVYPPFYLYGWYGTVFSDQLITGTYHLAFTDKDGETSEKDFVFNNIVNLPIVPSSSFQYYRDHEGNFIVQWQVPYINPKIQSSVRAQIIVYDEQEKYLGEVLVTMPINMGLVSIPKSIINQVFSMGKTHKLFVVTITNDNNNRTYSTGVLLPDLIPQPTACTSTLNANLLLHVPYLYYNNGAMTLSADFVYAFNPIYPTAISFKLTNYNILSNPSFSCTASTLSSDLTIHIPDVLFSDGTTHLWVDLEYSPALSTGGNFYWVVSNYGLLATPTPTSTPTPTPTPFPTPTPTPIPTTTPTPTCTGYTYSEWSACGITNTQPRTVTASIPSGCSGGAVPVTSQACTFTPPAPGDMCQNANAMLQGNWYKNMGSTTYMFDQVSFASANDGFPEGYFTGTSGGTQSSYIYNIDDTCKSIMLLKDLGNGTAELYRTYNYVVTTSILKLEIVGKIAYYCKDSPNSCTP